MSIKHNLRKYLWRIGYDITRFKPSSHSVARRKQLLDFYNIDTVLDIGANSGQFALELRDDLGYENKIISFEPLSSAYNLLYRNAKGDQNWDVFNIALGDDEEKCEINIAGNSLSSSLLKMLPAHINSAPGSAYIDKEIIQVKTLDSIFNSLCTQTNKVYMKIDTQGFESKVLKGAENSLKQIDTVQLEMSLVPLYEGEVLFNEMCVFMSDKGYNLVAIEPVFSNPDTGQLLQLDGIFQRLSDDLKPYEE